MIEKVIKYIRINNDIVQMSPLKFEQILVGYKFIFNGTKMSDEELKQEIEEIYDKK